MQAWMALSLVAIVGVACSKNPREPQKPPGPGPAQAADGTLQPGSQPMVILTPESRDEVRVRVEIARTDAELEKGLMYRREMAADAGMIFLFDRDKVQTFWMKNTYIPLDMIFITSDLKVVGVSAMAEPLTTSPRTVGKPSQYVLEVNGGFAAAHGIGPGTRARFANITP